MMIVVPNVEIKTIIDILNDLTTQYDKVDIQVDDVKQEVVFYPVTGTLATKRLPVPKEDTKKNKPNKDVDLDPNKSI